MRDAGFQAPETLRPLGGASGGGHGDHDAEGLQRPLPRDGRSALRTGDSRLGGGVPAAGGGDETSGALSGGGRGASGSGRADGGLIRAIGGGPADQGPRFDVAVPKGGYRWWYVDALSEDGQFGITVIAFIGSVFSPYYAWSGWADPYDHCAVNVALYSPKGGRWAMTERGRKALHQEAHVLSIGPSSLAWENGALTIRFDEITAPIPSRLRGTLRLHPSAMVGETYPIDAAGRHLWRPIAPRADVEVTLDHPASAWRGQGYFDTNWGEEPLERGFVAWDWSRAHRPRDTLLFYDVERRGGERAGLALRIGAKGNIEPVDAPHAHAQPLPFWRMPRQVRGGAAEPPILRRTLEDAPFYTRSALDGVFEGEPAEIVHESLSLNRLRSPIVRAMLPFRMPRRFW